MSKSTDLILHIGLPKTATTSLQRYWAERVNYLGVGGKNEEFILELLKIFILMLEENLCIESCADG